MRVIWIVFIAFTFALFAPGNSLPSRYPKEANIVPELPSDSVKHRLEVTTDDITGTGSYANDKPSYTALSRGTLKGITNKDLLTSPDLSRLLKSINLGKHLSKKVVQLLKLRPDLLTSLSEALQDVGHRSSQVGQAQLHGPPMSAHDTNVKLTNGSPEMDDQVIKASPEFKGAGTMSGKPSEADNQAILPKANLNLEKFVKQIGHKKEPYSGKTQDSYKSTSDVLKLGSNERQHKYESEPEDMDLKSETDELSRFGTKRDSSAPEDKDPKLEKEELSGSDTDWDSGAPEDMDHESETKEPGDMEPESETDHDEMSRSDADWDSGTPEDEEHGSETDELSGSDADWDSGAPEEEEPGSETDDLSESDSEWDAGEPNGKDPESEKDRLSGSKVVEQEAQTEDQSGTGIVWNSGAPEGMDPGSDTDELSGSVTDWDSRDPEDMDPGLETESVKKPDTDVKLASERLLRKFSRKILPPKSTDAERIASEKEAARPSSKGKRYASGYKNDFEFDNLETEPNSEPFSSPMSEIRWSGTSLADSRSFDGVPSVDEKIGKKKLIEGGISIASVTVLVFGGLFFLLLMGTFCVVGWPIRKYYQEKYRQMHKEGVEAGLDDEEEISIRVDRSHTDCEPITYYPPPQSPEEPSSPPYIAPVVQPLADETFAFNGQGSYGGMPQEAQSYERSTIEVLIDDWLRDPRDVERRKIIKRQSFEKRHSLADSLLIAKSVIDGHAKNKKFEKKASERRRVIKSCGSALTQSGGRRTSFADEIQTARSVIVPAWDYKESLERSKEKCRTIKDTFAGKRRPSLLEEIGVAKNVIVDSEKRKYELPPAVVEEMLIANMAPGGPMKFYEDVLNKLIRMGSKMERRRPSRNTSSIAAAEQQSMVENEMLWNGDRV